MSNADSHLSSMHILETQQNLPISLKEAWDFFSSPGNLKEITPAHMSFEITSGYKKGDKMYPGMIITYIVKPVLKISMNWVTEITHVQEPDYFVDEQRFGPYALWHHKHFFKEIEGGVQMTDIIHYKIPMGLIGKLANQLYIFKHRHHRLEELFGKWPDKKG